MSGFKEPTGMPTVFDPSYKGAGQKVGIEIWRVEKLAVVKKNPDDKAYKGQLHTGDAYIVLQTKKRDNALERHIFFWLGDESSQDEQGVAAYKTVELDESLGGEPVQHRECQYHETDEFLHLFPQGLAYQEGGVATGFKHVDREAFETRLFQVKGRRNIRVMPVKVDASSLNSGDVFILDAGRQLFQWNGKEASKIEKQKAMDHVRRIRDEERSGKATVAIIEQGRDDDTAFWQAMGCPKPSRIADAAAGGDDEAHSRQAADAIKLYKISDASGKLQITEVTDRPLKQELLDTNEAYVLDTGAAGIFAWVGKGASKTEKLHVMKYATEFISQKGYPKSTPVTRCVEGGETPLFKQNFVWKEKILMPGQTGQKRKSFQKKSFDAASMHARKAKEEARLPDKGDGELEIWRIEDFEPVPWPKERWGDFFSGDSYLMLYTYLVNTKKHYIIYFWQGHKSTQDERGAVAAHAVALDDKYGGEPVQVRVVQNKEPPHFNLIFKRYGGIVIHEGGKGTGFKNVDQADYEDKDGTRLFQIKGSSDLNCKASQVPERAASLNSGDVFVLETPKSLFLWFGKFCSGDEREQAKQLVKRIKSGEYELVQEGREPEAFWEGLGGREPYAEIRQEADEELHDPRLFQCSDARGYFYVEEVFDFDQEDLIEDDVMILDTYNEVFVWIGNGAKDNEKKEALQTAIKYIESDNSGRTVDDTVIMQIKQGFEPPNFTAHFPAWDAEKWSQGKTYDELKAELMASTGNTGAAAAVLGTSVTEALKVYSTDRVIPYEDLIKNDLPEGVDPTRKEQYLSEDDFQKHFKMSKAEFNALPKWKGSGLKKKVGLF